MSAPRDSAVRNQHKTWPDTPRKKRVTVGPVAGVNFATWSGSDVGDGAKRRTGFHAGLMLNADLDRIFGIQTGAAYSQEGTGVDVVGSTVEGTIKVDYIRVPLLLKARAELRGSKLRPYAVVGPSMGIKIKCRVEASDGSQSASSACDDPSVGLNLTTADFGLVLGLGLDFERFSAGFRYVPGLRSIDDTSNDAAEVHNNLLALTAGFAF